MTDIRKQGSELGLDFKVHYEADIGYKDNDYFLYLKKLDKPLEIKPEKTVEEQIKYFEQKIQDMRNSDHPRKDYLVNLLYGEIDCIKKQEAYRIAKEKREKEEEEEKKKANK